MKTILVSPCFLEGEDYLKNNRLDRNKRYLSFYSNIRDKMGFDEVTLLDNASSQIYCDEIISFSKEIEIALNFIRFDNRLARWPGPEGYSYCWRALYELKRLFKKVNKIIWIDSDGFVISKELAQYIKECNSGWVSFLCETYNFPESSIFILNKDSFQRFENYFSEISWEKRVGRLMEKDLPFTHVNSDFKVGRFGEIGKPKQDETMDYYGQASLDIELEFGKYK